VRAKKAQVQIFSRGRTEIGTSPYFSVVIPTYKRGHVIEHALDGLRKQTFKNFEVVVVVRSSGDGTEGKVDSYASYFNIKKVVLSNKYHHWDQLNYGIRNSSGSIISFLDDDAIPLPNWLEMQAYIFGQSGVGGIAGDVITARIVDGSAVPLAKDASEIIPMGYRPALETIGSFLWSRPLKGLENNLIYITKSGTVEKSIHCNSNTIVRSVLGMGTNMSVLREALGDFVFPQLWNGSRWEQFLGWYLWRRGYSLLFCPEVKVYHLAHGQTLSRFIKDGRTTFARSAGMQLFFYNLYELERQLSIMYKLVSNIFELTVYMKKMAEDKNTNQAKLKGLIYGNLLGMTWLISKKLKLDYSPLEALGTQTRPRDQIPSQFKHTENVSISRASFVSTWVL
jgi:glycosyltransferase involved in cell wall biosynthesis